MSITPEILALGGLRAALELHAGALAWLVDRHGDVKGLRRRASRKDAARDFCMFCITKSQRAATATCILLDTGYSEETYSITRTVWEHYIAHACVVADNSLLDEFLMKPLGLRIGTLAHRVSKSGKPIRRNIVHVESGATVGGQMTTAQLVGATGYPTDARIHSILYTFLSEHTHPNIIAIGNYWDVESQRFRYDSHSGLLQAAFWATLASGLLLREALNWLPGKSRRPKPIAEANLATDLALQEALAVLETGDEFRAIPELVSTRLKEAKEV